MQINQQSTTETQWKLTNRSPETSTRIVENGTGRSILGINNGDSKQIQVPNLGNVTELNGTKNIPKEKVFELNTDIKNSYPKGYKGPTEGLLRLKNGNLGYLGADQFGRVEKEFGKHSADMQLNEEKGTFSHPSLPKGAEIGLNSSPGMIEANPQSERLGEKAIDAAQEKKQNDSSSDSLKFKMPGM